MWEKYFYKSRIVVNLKYEQFISEKFHLPYLSIILYFNYPQNCYNNFINIDKIIDVYAMTFPVYFYTLNDTELLNYIFMNFLYSRLIYPLFKKRDVFLYYVYRTGVKYNYN